MTDQTPIPTEADPRWAAVTARDRSADGGFVYSVKTTSVYCRPSCGSRQANPKNVRFHAGPAEAEAAGFRACKRCRPNEAVVDAHAEAAAQACRIIEAAEEPPTLDALAAAVGLSPHHFHRLFKAQTGLTPKAYADAHRAWKVREALPHAGSVTEAIYDSGFNSGGRFYEQAGAILGMTPTAYRAGGADAVIRFAIGESALGSILVAESDKGVCAILMGDDPDRLARDLQDRFPRARLVGGDAAFEQRVAQVIGFVEAPRLGLNLPLDVRGSAFQQRVWQALRDIPAGETRSYAEVAEAIGSPKAVRAVAGACAANPLAVAVPCHRVVKTDGAISGYRWGVERKRELLKREGVAA